MTICLAADEHQKLQSAAEIHGFTINQFVLQAALDQAHLIQQRKLTLEQKLYKFVPEIHGGEVMATGQIGQESLVQFM